MGNEGMAGRVWGGNVRRGQTQASKVTVTIQPPLSDLWPPHSASGNTKELDSAGRVWQLWSHWLELTSVGGASDNALDKGELKKKDKGDLQ